MTLSQQAEELIAQWNEGLTLVKRLTPIRDMVVTISKDDQGRYHVTRFFPVGGRWNASADARGVTADDAFEALGTINHLN